MIKSTTPSPLPVIRPQEKCALEPPCWEAQDPCEFFLRRRSGSRDMGSSSHRTLQHWPAAHNLQHMRTDEYSILHWTGQTLSTALNPLLKFWNKWCNIESHPNTLAFLVPTLLVCFNKQREIIALDRQGTQQQRPESPAVTSVLVCLFCSWGHYNGSHLVFKATSTTKLSGLKKQQP